MYSLTTYTRARIDTHTHPQMSRLSESGHTDVYTDWAADGSHGELDASRFSDPWTRTGQYYSRFRKCWNTAECTVDEVVFKVRLLAVLQSRSRLLAL